MKIGTPLSESATRVMLLGSGELGKEVIIELQRLGVEVIAVDRYEHAPGHQVAHRAYVMDMTDGPALKALVKKERPHIIVPEIEAIATDMLAEIEAESLAEVIPTARATQLTMNREGIRRLVAEQLVLPTSSYGFASSLGDLKKVVDEVTGYPCIIKPVMSSSGKGQSRLESADDLESAWEYAMTAGRVNQGRVIVEGVVDFDYEITQLTVRALNVKGTVETHFCAPVGHLQKNGDYVESWQPQKMSEVALDESRRIAQRVTDALGGRGIFGVELFIRGDQVWFSEVSPRPHDTGLVTLITQWQSEFALHVRALLGLPVDTTLRNAGASAVIYGGMNEPAISYTALEQALSVPGSELRLFGKSEAYEHRRMGVAIASGADVDEARGRARLVASKVITEK